MSVAADTLEQLTERGRQFYTLPAVAMQVLELTRNPQIDARALKDCIENDPALTGKILRVVNSSLFGLSREVSDLNHALALLGIKPLKLLVLGFSLPPALFHSLEAETLGWYWRRTLTRSVAAREIAENVWRQPGDEAFIAGLLQDLGMLLLIQEIGRPYLEILDRTRLRGGDLAALEAKSLGFDHTMLTASLLRHWRLPETLVEAICPQGLSEQHALVPAAQRLTEIVQVAGLVARVLVDGHAHMLEPLLAKGLRAHALRPAQLEELAATLDDKVRQLGDVLSVPFPDSTNYLEVLAQAQAQLAETAEEVAEDMLRSRHQRFGRPDVDSLADEVDRLTEAVAQALRKPPAPAALAGAPPANADPHLRRLTTNNKSDDSLDATLANQLATAAAVCRQRRRPLSLLLADFARSEEMALTDRPEALKEIRRFLESACEKLAPTGAVCLPFHETGFAVILPGCERREAVEFGNRLSDLVRRFYQQGVRGRRPATCVGIGVATVSMPPANFPPSELFVAANRCLYGSHSCGGGGVKSIEIY